MFQELTPELKKVFKDSASMNRNVRSDALQKIAKAVELPLREAVFSGDVLGNIYEVEPVESGVTTVEYPLHPIAPGTEDEHAAYTIPKHGLIPYAHIDGDYVMVPIYGIANSIDWDLRFAKAMRYNVLATAMEALEAGFVKKMNDDGWQTLITAGYDRNIVVTDTDATAGQFTKRLVSLMQVVMERNGGGNSNSMNRSRLTDLYISTEAMADIKNWNVDQIDEVTRREIFLSGSGDGLSRIFGVNLHVMTELGEGQEYELFYENTLSGSLPSGDVELVIGLDRTRSDSFVMPTDGGVELFEDDNLHRHQQAGLYGWGWQGFSVLNSARVLLGSL